MRTRRELETLTTNLGARPETLEKVLLLLDILRRLDAHELTTGRWVLKGGTALNVFHLNLPRLSVDIDLNFVGAVEREEFMEQREPFINGLRACCERAGCAVRRIPNEHAGGKIRLQFNSVFGRSQNLEVDINFVLRTPILGVDYRAPVAGIEDEHRPLPLLKLPELAAGKFCALLTRREPRDFYDAIRLVELDGTLPERPEFRQAFVVLAACSRVDFRELTGLPDLPAESVIRSRLQPMLRLVPGEEVQDAVSLLTERESGLHELADNLLAWAPGERRFLDRLNDEGEVDAELLTDDLERQENIRTLPILRWKQQHVRSRLELDD